MTISYDQRINPTAFNRFVAGAVQKVNGILVSPGQTLLTNDLYPQPMQRTQPVIAQVYL